MSCATDNSTSDMDSSLQALGVIPSRGEQFFGLADEELSEIEGKLSIRLPEAYRRFLLVYGATSFRNLIMFRPVHPLPMYPSTGGGSYVSFFYGPSNSARPVSEFIRDLSARMPENLIPIGGDVGGNQICLGIRGEEAGKVYYWDHEHEWDEEDYLEQGLPVPPDLKFQNVYRIADSFEDFIARLYVVEE